jgi:CRISPR/Cas system-associated exonuclease Cas4 (RecB family)
MPKIFTLIDSQMKAFYSGKRTEEIAEGAPPGAVIQGEKWVESKPIRFPGRVAACYVKGKFDTLVQFDDGSFGVIDFKTSQRKAEHVQLYSRQLHAYAYALENPASRGFSAAPVSRLGLLVFEPEKYAQSATGYVGFAGRVSWIEIPRDDESFRRFLEGVVEVLELPEAPAANPDCQWCRYREDARQTGL